MDTGANAKGPPLTLLVSVHVVCRKEKPAKWGDVEVMRPAEVAYKLGNEETPALANVADFVRKGWAAVKDTPGAEVGGEIKSGHKVPFSMIFDVMETFEAAGCARLCFYGTAAPSAALREAARLPYPLKNYDTVD
jgi:hypothetical protein